MYVLTVAYGHPDEPAAFDAHYTSTHTPLAQKVPGLKEFNAQRCASLVASPPPYYLLARLSFDSRADLDAGLASPEGQAAAADVPNFATGGATMFITYDE